MVACLNPNRWMAGSSGIAINLMPPLKACLLGLPQTPGMFRGFRYEVANAQSKIEIYGVRYRSSWQRADLSSLQREEDTPPRTGRTRAPGKVSRGSHGHFQTA